MKKDIVKIDDFTRYSFLGAPLFSPLGSRLAFIRRMADLESNGYIKELWVESIRTRQLKQITYMDDAAIFCWNDETHILFPSMQDPRHREIRKRHELLTVFYSADTDTGKCEEAFSVPLDVTAIQKLDDSLFLISAWSNAYRPDAESATGAQKEKLLQQVEDDLLYEIVDEVPFWWDGLEYTNKRRTRIYLYNADADVLQPVTGQLFNTVQARFIRESKQVLLVGQEFDSVKLIDDGVYLYDIETGKTICLMQPGMLRVYWADALSGYAILAATDRKTHGMYENPKFYRVPLSGGPIELLAEYDRSINDMLVTDNKYDGGGTLIARDGYIWFISTERYDTVLRRLSADGKIENIISKAGAVNMFDVCDGLIAHISMRTMALQELFLLDTKTGLEECLTSWNDALLKNKTLSPACHFIFKARDGYELDGWIIYPVGYEKEKRYPAILDIHGGPPAAYGEIMVHEMQVWASLGYVVLYTNPRGGEGRGNEFMDIRGRWGTVDYTDIMDFVDEALKRFDAIDPKRMGVTGGSYGGFMTNWIVGHTDRFAAAASQRSVANMISSVGHSGSGYDYVMGEVNENLWAENAIQTYWEHSPLKYADRAKTPILFIHSDHDRDCFLSEGLQMFTAVRLAGCTARMCIMKGEGHGLSRTGHPKQRIRRLEEITGWFERYLKESK